MYTGLIDANASRYDRARTQQSLLPLLNHGFNCLESCSCRTTPYQETLYATELGLENKPVQVCCDIPMSFCSQENHKRPLPHDDGFSDCSVEEMMEIIAQRIKENGER